MFENPEVAKSLPSRERKLKKSANLSLGIDAFNIIRSNISHITGSNPRRFMNLFNHLFFLVLGIGISSRTVKLRSFKHYHRVGIAQQIQIELFKICNVSVCTKCEKMVLRKYLQTSILNLCTSIVKLSNCCTSLLNQNF